MLQVSRRVAEGKVSKRLLLAYDDRKKSRLRVCTEDGVELAIQLERGSGLRHGDLLAADSGEIIEVHAAPEWVSEVSSDDALRLLRAAYHLGNRHVPLEVALGVLRYQHDHVLDGMVRELGLDVRATQAPFEPERGAYSGGGGHGHHGHHH
ncbi:MAG: urease accessory protein UreE [Polyangiales bacterium]